MYCPNCGADCGDAKFCPNCGAALVEKPKQPYQPKKKKHRGIKGLIIAVVVIAVVIGVCVKISEMPSTPSSPTVSQAPDLELVDSHTEGNAVIGHIKNNTDKEYSYISVDVDFYNNGSLVYTGTALNTHLGAGETWEFNVPCFVEADEYKISGDSITSLESA